MKLGVPPNWLGKSFDWASKKIILSLRCFPKKKEEWTYKVAAFWPKGKNFIQYLSEFFPNLSGGTPNVISFIFTYRCRKNQKKLVTEINHQVSEISPYYQSILFT